MDSARWERIQTLFHDAAELPESARHKFLQDNCDTDDTLLADVLAMLEEDAKADSLLDQNMADVAHGVMSASGPEPLPLHDFGPYRVQKMLGEGGMGVVYLAERVDLGSLVAIKVLRDAWLSPARRERFASEQRMLAQLTHPSIARLYDADTLTDGTPWFVMEYVEGVPLTEYCSKQKCSVQDRLHLFRSVCEAVQYAHSHALIHRDLKPSNILVKDDGTVRLLDFGIAKQMESLEEGQLASDATMTGMRLMTPAYAAPEQIRGERVGVHTDVYSLGVILYELLAGRRPFDLSNKTPAEAETVIVEQEPERPSVAARQLSEWLVASAPLGKGAWADLDVLCLTAMHKDTQRRYRSVEALVRDIDHYLKGEPLEARPDSLRYRVGKFVTRNRRAVLATTLAFVILAFLIIFFTLRLAKARDAALAEAARTQRIQHFMMNLFQGGDEAAGPSDNLRVVTLLDRGIQEAKALNGDPKVQAELYQNLSGIYGKLGKFDSSVSLLDSALAERTQLFGADSPEVAESLVAKGLVRADQAQFDEAERLVRQGLDIDKRKLPANHPAVARATFALGKVLEDRGRYSDAITALDEAVRLQSAAGATTDLAASLSELANSHFYAGHYDVSKALNQRVLDLQRKLYGERHPLVADTFINLGSIEFQLGHFKESEQFNRQGLEIIQAWYGKDHPETADAMTTVGQSLTYQQRFDEAAAMLQQALAILEHAYGPVHPRVAYALNELGNVAVRQGKLDDAEKDFNRVISIYHVVYGDQHHLLGVAKANLAGVYFVRKDYARSERLFRDALTIYAKTLPATHLTVGITRIRLGSVLREERRYKDAESESRGGYEILMKQTSPTVKWLQTARNDLAEDYAALGRTEDAARFRAAVENDKNIKTASK